MERKPEWLRVRYNQQAVSEVAELMRDLKLNTVCKAANCPNLGECYQKHTATFMLLGDVCTRSCRFCNVTCGKPLPPDPDEPENVAQAAEKLGLRHVVLTCATRDDLPDGGAEHFAKTIRAIRARCRGTTVETLTSDMKGDHAAADIVIAAHPEVFNLNIETVRELQKAVRPQADYARTLGVLRYVTSLRNADLQILMIALIAVTIGLLFIGSIFFLSSFFIKSILVPVSQINATARRIAAGSYGVQIPGQYDDEIGELVSTINDMSVKIGQAEKTQTEFISSVSHELRTPLTAISGWGETLLTSENLDAETRRGVVIIAREAKRLTGMVEELLEFTRMQDGRFTLHVETADILAEFEDTVFMYGNRLKQEGICLHYDGCDEEIPEIPCDVARMRQVFLNILDNAAKHGGEGKRIDASIAHEGSFVVIRMRDYGPGIPEEELPHVKLKFYKGSSKARGSGIGLAVCEEIVTMHGGTLTLENAEGGGTLVTISIPTGEE